MPVPSLVLVLQIQNYGRLSSHTHSPPHASLCRWTSPGYSDSSLCIQRIISKVIQFGKRSTVFYIFQFQKNTCIFICEHNILWRHICVFKSISQNKTNINICSCSFKYLMFIHHLWHMHKICFKKVSGNLHSLTSY